MNRCFAKVMYENVSTVPESDELHSSLSGTKLQEDPREGTK